ncbi:MAG: hypothetical protein JOY93_01255 [Acidobacteriales bacterium]|nr:hypothetical protein [Terriglobales bacterium]
MRWCSGVLAVAVMAITASAASGNTQNTVILPCGQEPAASATCTPSKKDLKEAKSAFNKGLKLGKAGHTDEAFDEYETASRLSPKNVEYVTARELTRQQLVFSHLEHGNKALLEGRQMEALADFRFAVHLDPQNDFAQQRLRDALGDSAPRTVEPPKLLADAGELHVLPTAGHRDFHFRGDSRALLAQVAGSFGLVTEFDDSVASRRVRFDIQDVDFYTAMRAAGDVTHTFWTALDEKQILVASETAENHRQFDRMALRTFYVPEGTSPTDLNDVVNLLRTVFEIRFVTPEAQSSTVVVRAPENVLDAATAFLEGLGGSRPQMMLDVKVYQISHSLTRNIGLQIPTEFNLFNIPAGALAALGGQNLQQLINQLIASGGINQANTQAISALLAQQQGQQNSIFSQPLATFGGGLTLEGLSLGTLGAQLSLNESWIKSLEHANLRVAQGNQATFRMGSRFPILNATFAPIYNTPAIAKVIGNNSFRAAFPSFNYEDIGLSLKAKPSVNRNSDVNLELEMQFRTLGSQSINGVPIISNREYKGSITLTDGQPAVVAGSLSRNEQRSLSGLPGLGFIPGLNQVMANNTKQLEEDELLLVITPHVISLGDQDKASEVWLRK